MNYRPQVSTNALCPKSNKSSPNSNTQNLRSASTYISTKTPKTSNLRFASTSYFTQTLNIQTSDLGSEHRSGSEHRRPRRPRRQSEATGATRAQTEGWEFAERGKAELLVAVSNFASWAGQGGCRREARALPSLRSLSG